MIETLLLKFYKQKLSNYALVYKYLLINITILIVSLFICTTFSIFYVSYKKYAFLSMPTVLSFFIPLIIGLIILALFVNLPATNFAKETYNIKLHSTDWELFRLYLLKEYLVENKFINNKSENMKENNEKIEMLISLIQQKLDNRQKNKPFSILGSYFNTSIVFLIPIWTAFNTQVYFKEVTLNEGINNIGTILGSLLILIAVFCMIKLYKVQFNFLHIDYKLQEILYMLTQLQIIHNNDKFSQKHLPHDQKDKIKTMVKNYNYNKTKNNHKEKNTTSFFKKYSYFKWK
ncbi:hypothetical protein [Bacillus thuringiensis]|uniref:hypothetical protein n=1 Tax=Bacillus thuringiensis TaxID=1428 RepID=UPI0024BD32D7|nr:hypothetical protein [Bacillus thuringiensis]